jgi:hypothetical protein
MAVILLSIAGSCALFQSAQADPSTFTDTSRDLMLVFRKTGFDGTGTVGSYVFEVDIGQASTYYGAALGSTIPITAYSASSQLSTVFDDLNDLSWSVGGCVPAAGDSGDPSKPANTLWVTDPRPAPGTSNPAWVRKSTYSQAGPDSHIDAILVNALKYAGLTTNSTYNTSTSLAIPVGEGDDATGSLGALGNYQGTFTGDGEGLNDVENTTSATFTTAGLTSQSDLYELQPGSGAGTYLGYFELGTDGSLTFHALPLSYPAPTLSVTKGSSSVFISFPSATNGTYTLYYTNAAGLTAPVSTWPTVSTNVTGDGTVKAFQQPNSATATFYTVSVH